MTYPILGLASPITHIGSHLDGNDRNTLALLHCEGFADASTSFIDSSDYKRTVTAVGNAQVDTARSKFGLASALMDGSGDYCSMPDAAELRPGTDDFTMEAWFFFTATTNSQVLFAKGGALTGGVAVSSTSGATPRVFVSGSQVGTYTQAFSTGAWEHWALVKASGVFTLYRNGIAVSSVADATNLNSAGLLTVGGAGGALAGDSVFGNWDEFRFSNIARWTANFTPPVEAYF